MPLLVYRSYNILNSMRTMVKESAKQKLDAFIPEHSEYAD
jgi:hypothetical protein